MTRGVTNNQEFNPFNHTLAADERYRIKGGKLTVEKSDVRANSWFKFFTRGQYSQSAVLKEMGRLYKAAKQEQNENNELHINNTFLENYKTLLGRANKQNNDCSKMNAIARFFNAKTEINLDSAQTKIVELTADLEQEAEAQKLKEEQEAQRKIEEAAAQKLRAEQEAQKDMEMLIKYKTGLTNSAIPDDIKDEFQAEDNAPWWDGQDIAEKDNIYDLMDAPIQTIETVLKPLGKIVKPGGNVTEELVKVLTTLGLYLAKDHVKKDIKGVHHLEIYLLKNKEALIEKLNDLKFIE